MCLAIPAKIVEIHGEQATVEQAGGRREAQNNLIHAKKGSWVLLQQGIVVEEISEKEALETLRMCESGD